MNLQLPVLFIPNTSSEVAADLDLPPPKENLFQRLIRNPHPNSDTPKERECTEMLAAVLLNATQLRTALFSWMGSLVGLEEDYWAGDDYRLRIRTEQSIGSKRDDLRIETWRLQDDEEILEVVWTVEVKVGAPIHLSSYQDLEEDSEEDATEEVSQLINYDLWLQQQAALNSSAHVAGFVLALGDMGTHLPPALNRKWACITWTQLGQQVEQLLEDESLISDDKLLGRHMVGFIRNHLWRDSEMSESTIDFDDLALIRAFDSMGIDCDRKVNDLVAPLAAVLEGAIDGLGNVTFQKALFKTAAKSFVYAAIPGFKQMWITAGVEGPMMRVRLSVSKSEASFKSIVKIADESLPTLIQRNPEWKKNEENAYHLLSLTKPLHSLLHSNDQAAAIESFVADALADLNESGVFEVLQRRLNDTAAEDVE